MIPGENCRIYVDGKQVSGVDRWELKIPVHGFFRHPIEHLRFIRACKRAHTGSITITLETGGVARGG